ncbi:hypothetical protein B0T19DRAFT_466165 [Cercophora scortea]|uniref:Myb-like DNA-binding domain-containing protein n=1 Tax=Cercophora scortea TaxID=314031 RepID=A0AAE0I9S4_9PEZI|nr:hypothetical protein B0T19DRAFT_466165 [Cercophora scortea]
MGKAKIPATPKAAPSGQPAPTPQEALFFFNIIKNMRNRPDIDWNAVAADSNLKNSDTAKVRFGQIKRKHGLENWGTSANTAGRNNNTGNSAAPTPTKASAPSTPRGGGVRKRAPAAAKKTPTAKLTTAVHKALVNVKKEHSTDGEDNMDNDDEEYVKNNDQEQELYPITKHIPASARPLKIEQVSENENENEEDENDGSEESDQEQDDDDNNNNNNEMAFRNHATTNARRSMTVGPAPGTMMAPAPVRVPKLERQETMVLDSEPERFPPSQLGPADFDWSQLDHPAVGGGGGDYQDWGLQADGASGFDLIPDVFGAGGGLGGGWGVFGGK